jgi:hypothetical protein
MLVVLGLGIVGCGPLQTPMPQRLSDEDQKNVTESWNRALKPVDRYGHQPLLDILISTQAYQVGVDRLSLHSEKKVAAGMVVMDIIYDRLDPTIDRFEVKVLNDAGAILRRESYGREEVETTCRELFQEADRLRKKKESGQATPQELRKLADLEARLKVVEDVFPKPEQKEPAKGAQPKPAKVAQPKPV